MDSTSLDLDFASCAFYYMCSDRDFYERLGKHITPDMFPDEYMGWIVKACHALYQETGRPPISEMVVIQRMTNWTNQGKLRSDYCGEAANLLMAGEAYSEFIDADTVISEIAPIVKYHLRHQLMQDAIRSHGAREDLERQCDSIKRVNRIGQAQTSRVITMGDGSLEDIKTLMSMERFSTGMDGIDENMQGGPPRKSITMWLGDTGDGKSMALTQIAATGVRFGRHVVYITLEIPSAHVFCRTKAPLTGFTVDDFMHGTPQALAAFEEISPKIGPMRVATLEANMATVADVIQIVEEAQQSAGVPVDILCLDYFDRLTISGARGSKKSFTNSYGIGEVAMNSLRDELTLPFNLYTHTASQTRRNDNSRRRKGNEDVSDSLHKVRISDNVFTLNVREDTSSGIPRKVMEVENTKHRTGMSGFVAGPVEVLFARGLVLPSRALKELSDTVAHFDEYRDPEFDYVGA